MRRAVVLGAAGGIGELAARTIALAEDFDELVVADLDTGPLEHLRRVPGGPQIVARHVDAGDAQSLASVLRDADVVVNCIGPFYRFGVPVLRAAIEAGVDYIDVCDDLDPTERMLGLHGEAQSRGVRALIGMGNSPGLANVLVRYAADLLLDQILTVDIMHIHGGEPDEGPAVLKHRILAMTSDVPVWEDGEIRLVRMLEDSGAAFVVPVEFRDVGTYPVYPYPHPETITLPRFLPDVQRVTNRGVVFPLTYFDTTRDLARAGACTTELLRVGEQAVVPLDFSVALLIDRRPALLREAGVAGPAGCLRIDVSGSKDGAPHEYVFSLSSSGAGAGEGTGIPAGLAALLMARGEMGVPGVQPPEAVVPPLAMLSIAASMLPRLDVGGTGGALPIHIEHRGPDGSIDELDLAL